MKLAWGVCLGLGFATHGVSGAEIPADTYGSLARAEVAELQCAPLSRTEKQDCLKPVLAWWLFHGAKYLPTEQSYTIDEIERIQAQFKRDPINYLGTPLAVLAREHCRLITGDSLAKVSCLRALETWWRTFGDGSDEPSAIRAELSNELRESERVCAERRDREAIVACLDARVTWWWKLDEELGEVLRVRRLQLEHSPMELTRFTDIPWLVQRLETRAATEEHRKRAWAERSRLRTLRDSLLAAAQTPAQRAAALKKIADARASAEKELLKQVRQGAVPSFTDETIREYRAHEGDLGDSPTFHFDAFYRAKFVVAHRMYGSDAIKTRHYQEMTRSLKRLEQIASTMTSALMSDRLKAMRKELAALASLESRAARAVAISLD